MGILETIAGIILMAVVAVIAIVFTIVLTVAVIPVFIVAGGVSLMQSGYPALGILVIVVGIGVGAVLYCLGGGGGAHISGWFNPD